MGGGFLTQTVPLLVGDLFDFLSIISINSRAANSGYAQYTGVTNWVLEDYQINEC